MYFFFYTCRPVRAIKPKILPRFLTVHSLGNNHSKICHTNGHFSISIHPLSKLLSDKVINENLVSCQVAVNGYKLILENVGPSMRFEFITFAILVPKLYLSYGR